ncbi:MAG: cupin domain-containing protein [Saprospiraceae bacterium]|nr:cupin domain-containing protein [Saprospiraceae bacterium]
MKSLSASEILELLDLKPHFEGGYFRRNYLSTETISGLENVKGRRHLHSAIYYLLTPDTHSKIHRLASDEIFHFYLGDPVEMLLLHHDGDVRIMKLGTDLSAGQRPQVVVPADTWQGSKLQPGGRFALMGTTMAPAFDQSDFETPDDLENFLDIYPTKFHEQIRVLW